VRCEVVERDRHSRQGLLAQRVDIGRGLVSAGAYRRYSKDYVDAEAEARNAKRGMWRGAFVKPWEWRVTAPRRPEASMPWSPAGTRRPPARS
jgi:endonuclease YncB( thermonuclease family)